MRALGDVEGAHPPVAASGGGSRLRVGSVAICITPPIGSPLQGQFRPRVALDIHDDLFARALIGGDGSTRAALVSCDVVLIDAPDRRGGARALVDRLTGIPGDQVMIHATHTEIGPFVADFDETLLVFTMHRGDDPEAHRATARALRETALALITIRR